MWQRSLSSRKLHSKIKKEKEDSLFLFYLIGILNCYFFQEFILFLSCNFIVKSVINYEIKQFARTILIIRIIAQ